MHIGQDKGQRGLPVDNVQPREVTPGATMGTKYVVWREWGTDMEDFQRPGWDV
jgi:hypothetical protein